MRKNKVGDLIKYYWDEFDGSGSELCVVIEVFDDHILATPVDELIFAVPMSKDGMCPNFTRYWLDDNMFYLDVEAKEIWNVKRR